MGDYELAKYVHTHSKSPFQKQYGALTKYQLEKLKHNTCGAGREARKARRENAEVRKQQILVAALESGEEIKSNTDFDAQKLSQ